MEIIWEEIYNNSHLGSCCFCESTYRTQIPGGWLVRHETCTDYQYGCGSDCEDNAHRHINEEGWQNISNVITFVPDPKHTWGTSIMDGVCLGAE